MPSIALGSTIVDSHGDNVYVIAEIGQNHQGSLEIAKEMILKAKAAGCNCVKFQKSDLETKFTKSALDRKYDGMHSWGTTYGEHKRYLEFSKAQYLDLQKFCRETTIDFTASAMDERSLQLLESMEVPFIKIGSGDANNFPLLRKAAQLNTSLVISTGMIQMSTVDKIVQIMKDAKKHNFALLHCVSSYPTLPADCNLQMIGTLKERYPDIVIGYSGHENGIQISKAAVLCGARIIERHFTLDKQQKGSDHRCSLNSLEFAQLVNEIKILKSSKQLAKPLDSIQQILSICGETEELTLALNVTHDKQIMQCELPCKHKLGKTIVAAHNLKAGSLLCESNIAIKVSEPNGILAEEYYAVIGTELINDVSQDMPILRNYIKTV